MLNFLKVLLMHILYILISFEYDIIAKPDCIALESDWENLLKSLKINYSNKSLNIFKRMNKLRKIFIFKNLSEKKLLALAQLMKKEKYSENEYIVKENTEGDRFYLINKGVVIILKEGKEIRELEKGNYFGEISLLNKENRTASVKAKTQIICYCLSKEDFLSIIDGNILDIIRSKIFLQDTFIKLEELFYIQFLGKGKFGNVSLVHNKKNIYAIKAISRKAVDRRKMLSKYFISEKKIMQQIDHPFIIKYVKSLKNENYCFFLLEFINGKNMDDYLTERKYLRNLEETKFYISSLMIILDYLHKKNIAHRDLKPSNIMIDKTGYLKMIDFGTSKIVTDFMQTIIGTPHYISPEILMGKGYSLTSDYWSMGICLYEIFYGFYPFGNNASDILEVYKDILHK
jgi:cGMP-dependent protein kinase